MSDSGSDDEYGPIAATWGSQAAFTTTTGTPSNDATEPAGWDSLLDPNIKTGPNDLGSGNLHRRGKNFKPIDEELILARRMNIQVPKKKMLEAIRQTEKNLGLPEDKSDRKGNNRKKKATSAKNPNTPPPRKSVDPVLSTIRPPPPPSSNSNWLQADLVDTPFWEKKEEPPLPIQTSVFSSASRNGNIKANGTPQSKSNSGSNEKSGWESYNTNTFEKSQSQNGWGSYNSTVENAGWNNDSWALESNNKNASESRNTNNNIPSNKPSWLNSIPDQAPRKSSPTTSRFSNPTKQRYSDSSTIEVPKPVNYRKDVNPIPLETAPAPPPENSLLITINVELSDTMKIPVDIRELDDPSQLANEFGQKNNITSVNVIVALTKLFTSQKELALKKKQQKLLRRVPRYSNYQQNVYTNSSRFSTYSSSTSYQDSVYQGSVYQPTTPYQSPSTTNTPAPFTRKAYY